MTIWDELLDEFRALGGRAENVRLGHGPLGRGLFTIDPGKPFLLHTPPSLLVSDADVSFENGALKVAAGASIGPRERKFFEDYNAHISWDGGGRAAIERISEQAQALPVEIRRKLATHYRCGTWFEDPSPGLIQRHFIGSRAFGGFKDRAVMMPMIELANHGPACSYGTDNGISLSGGPTDEITVNYSVNADAYGLFRSWCFVCERDVAFSSELGGPFQGAQLYIDRQTGHASLPILTKVDDGLKLNFLILGNRNAPRLCRGNFRSVFRTAGIGDVDETFDKIRAMNLQLFISLLTDLEDVDGQMARDLRRMARLQLLALTYCFGAREI